MIELEAVERIFQVGEERVHALRDLSLTVQSGEYPHAGTAYSQARGLIERSRASARLDGGGR